MKPAYTATIRLNTLAKQPGGREMANGIVVKPEGEALPGSSFNLMSAGTGMIQALDPDVDYVLTLTPVAKPGA